MKKLVSLILVFLSLIITSCKFGTTFEVENKTNLALDSLSISNGFNTVYAHKMDKNEKISLFLNFKNNNTKSDGNFVVKYKANNKQRKTMFGYYSNGMPSDENVKIQIYKDTVIIGD
ncbi:hypothetical protein [Flavobacterium sp. GT3R68]|uniref:hypothetical protein n=1 Tax=Flavobacterium sp. GT3R68 TaxID=2594437 RepID=UPI000F88306C|nr:hypothetical protein [Flavobacterium sp. GT3R68]RTY86203.1 hypothetical protein EKL32_27960 [Flavobacterium sp. GSN2]TRW94017.1 hypothetical protein FNW07_03645 [Flavobacterium sp. GT3R68]